MPALTTNAELVAELNGTGTGPYTIWDVAGVTSGQVATALNDADGYLRRMVGSGPSDSSSAPVQALVKDFERVYGGARLLFNIFGIVTTDGFNYSLGGLDVQRVGAKLEAYKQELDLRMKHAGELIAALHEWFLVFEPSQPRGVDEYGNPVSYWSTSQPRY